MYGKKIYILPLFLGWIYSTLLVEPFSNDL